MVLVFFNHVQRLSPAQDGLQLHMLVLVVHQPDARVGGPVLAQVRPPYHVGQLAVVVRVGWKVVEHHVLYSLQVRPLVEVVPVELQNFQ